MIRKLLNWLQGRESNGNDEAVHANGVILDEAWVSLLREYFDKGRWDEDMVKQVSEHTGIHCTAEDLRPYYPYAYGEFKLGGDMGICMAKFKGIVAMQFRMDHEYLRLFGPGPAR